MNKEDLNKLNEDYLKYVSCFNETTFTDGNFIFSSSHDSHHDYNDYSDD